MKVLLFGVTGMVGQGVLRECLIDDRVTEIVSVIRSRSGKRDPKLSEIVLPDVTAIAQTGKRLSGFDACFFCLGVSSVGLSEKDYASVTFGLTLAVAAVLAPHNPDMTFICVTGAGTGRNRRNMWARVKARTEDGLAAMPFKTAYFFRPAFIQLLHGVVSKTRWYITMCAALRPISPLLTSRFPAIATTTERLGKAMINVAAFGYSTRVLGSRAINLASETEHRR